MTCVIISDRFDEFKSQPSRFGPWWSSHKRVISGKTFAFIRVKNARGKVVAIQVATPDRAGFVKSFHR